MLFNSADFLIFLPIAVIVYYILPAKARYIWLLGASYYFYMCWEPRYALLILSSTVVTYFCGLILQRIEDVDRPKEKRAFQKKLAVAVSLVFNLGLLAYFKYFNFLLENVNYLLERLHPGTSFRYADVLLPVGISFYTFQALGYTIDVYRGRRAEKNFLRYALFVSFFPQLVAGPIERSDNLLGQLKGRHRFTFENLKTGFLWILWGYFLKLVIADRAAIIVNTVFDSPGAYPGMYVVVAGILFAVQIYGDFYGYTMIARGSARLMGIHLAENFNSPHLSRTIQEFWRRWHISLCTWFKDYLYIPLGGNRKGKFRQYLNIFIVFLASGLWHGASWGYIIWGTMHGVFQITGALLGPVRDRVVGFLRINREWAVHKLLKISVTFTLVWFALMFFRAKTVGAGAAMLKALLDIFRDFNVRVLIDGSLFELGVCREEFFVLIIAIGVLLVVDIIKYRKIDISKTIISLNPCLRLLIFTVLFMVVFMLGVYGVEYDASQFIYFQF